MSKPTTKPPRGFKWGLVKIEGKWETTQCPECKVVNQTHVNDIPRNAKRSFGVARVTCSYCTKYGKIHK